MGGNSKRQGEGTKVKATTTSGGGTPVCRTIPLGIVKFLVFITIFIFVGLKAKPLDPSIFTQNMCNCWCTQWAEVHARRPTGNFSWILRVQNSQNPAEMFPDFHLSDISNLFLPLNTTKEEVIEAKAGSYSVIPKKVTKIDSTFMNETEYASMMEEYFLSTNTNTGEFLLSLFKKNEYS